jgi:hypothetical protein
MKTKKLGSDSAVTISERLLLAGMAMQGMIANPKIKRPHPEDGDMIIQNDDFAKIAFEFADALLKLYYGEEDNKQE